MVRMNTTKAQPTHIEALDQWFQTDLGRLVQRQEARRLARVSRGLFGYYLIEVSHLCSHPDYLAQCPVRRHFRISPCAGGEISAVARPEALPVASDFVDAVILPHTLDFAEDPRQVLREVERVLIPEGKVVITGFNPWSLWGVWRAMPGAGRRLPWRGHFLSFSQVEDWLSLLGFDIEAAETLIFRPPWKHAFLMRQARLLERIGARWWPSLAGVYLLVATKRVSTLTPVRPRWRLWSRLRKAGVVTPAAGRMEKLDHDR